MDEDQTLSDYAAAEIRATLARRRITGRDLAAKLNVSRSWISYRLTGTTEIGLNDLERIARALEVEVADLLPTPALRDERGDRRTSNRSTAKPDHLMAPRSARLLHQGPHVGQSEPDHQRISDEASVPRAAGRRPAIRPWRHEGVTA